MPPFATSDNTDSVTAATLRAAALAKPVTSPWDAEPDDAAPRGVRMAPRDAAAAIAPWNQGLTPAPPSAHASPAPASSGRSTPWAKNTADHLEAAWEASLGPRQQMVHEVRGPFATTEPDPRTVSYMGSALGGGGGVPVARAPAAPWDRPPSEATSGTGAGARSGGTFAPAPASGQIWGDSNQVEQAQRERQRSVQVARAAKAQVERAASARGPPRQTRAAQLREASGALRRVAPPAAAEDGARPLAPRVAPQAAARYLNPKRGQKDYGANPANRHAYGAPATGPRSKECGVRYKQLRGCVWPPTSRAPVNSAQPQPQLALESVHAYNGRCRDNVLVTGTGELVFFAAAVGVVHAVDGTQRFFTGHDDDMTCMAMHPSKQMVASGQVGKEPAICLWGTSSVSERQRLQGAHTRKVVSLGFCGDGELLVSVGGDDSHTIAVWQWRTATVLCTASGEKGNEVWGCVFSPMPAADCPALVSFGARHIKFWRITPAGKRSLQLVESKSVMGKRGETQDCSAVAFAKNGNVLGAMASGHVYEFRGNKLVSMLEAHPGGVTAMCALDDGICTGGADSKIVWWKGADGTRVEQMERAVEVDLNSGLPLPVHARSLCSYQGKLAVGTSGNDVLVVNRSADRGSEGRYRIVVQAHAGAVNAVGMYPSPAAFVTVGSDCTCRVWSIAEHRMLLCGDLSQPGTAVSVSPDGSFIAVGCDDGSCCVIEVERFRTQFRWKDRVEKISVVAFSPDGSVLAVGSHDNFIDLYRAQDFSRYATCRGHSSYVTHLDFSSDGQFLQSTCGANELLYWQVETGAQNKSSIELRDLQWATWSCTFGWPVMGIWPAASDGTDVNAVDRNPDGSLLLTSDDFGEVKLFRYPCHLADNKPVCRSRSYVGHSSHVAGVKWTYDGQRAVSVGGADCGIFVWAIEN